jgi:hypothetical protein
MMHHSLVSHHQHENELTSIFTTTISTNSLHTSCSLQQSKQNKTEMERRESGQKRKTRPGEDAADKENNPNNAKQQ